MYTSYFYYSLIKKNIKKISRLSGVMGDVIKFNSCLNLPCIQNTNIVWIHRNEKIIWKQKKAKCKCLPNNLVSIEY